MNKLNRIVFFAVLFILVCGRLRASGDKNNEPPLQNIQAETHVKGKVVDASTNEPIIGATVGIKGTTTGVITNLDGEFSLDLKDPDAILEISFVGYTKVEIQFGTNTELTIALESRIEELEQVVVIGYGVTRKADVVGAISSVNSKEINNLMTTNVSQAIQGRAAGVEVVNSSGAPGATVKIKVRGTGTVNNSDPLYVVDGFVVEDISYLNPEDIKDFQILKDASSSAIYGARAANGVLLITTKRGEKGEVKFTFSANYGISEMWQVPERTNKEQYLQLYEEYAGKSYFTANPSVKDRVIFEQYGVENWLDYIYRNGVTQKYNLQASGGNENNSFLISGTWADDKGIFITSNNNKRSVRINMDNKLAKFLNLKSGVSASSYNTRKIEEADVFKNTFNRAPSLTYYNRNYIFVDDSGNVVKDYKITWGDHVYDKINRRVITEKASQYNGNFDLEAKILNGLTNNTRFGFDMEFFQGMDAWKAEGSLDNYNPNTGGYSVNKQEKKSKRKWQAEDVLSYSKSIKEHNVLLLIGVSLEGYKEEFVWYEELGAPDNDIGSSAPDANYKDALVNGASKKWTAMGIPARFDYNFQHKYYFQANFRADASSKFRPDQRWGYFPSLSAGWAISEEKFMKSAASWLNQLKLRANWGKSGNNRIEDYSAYTLIKSEGDNIVVFGRTNMVYRQGWAPDSYGNPDISWEKTTGSNIGLDFTMFAGSISGSMEVFEKTTTDMLLKLPLPLSLGLDKDKNPWQNAGSVKNTGFEIMLAYKKVIGDFSAEVRGNYSRIQNKVIKLGEEGNPVLGGYYDIGKTDGINQTYVTYTAVGMPIGMFYGYKIDRSKHANGIWHTSDSEDGTVIPASAGATPEGTIKPGDFIYVDMNGDGVVNDNDKTFLGTPHPKALYGLNINLQYKGVGITAFFQGVYGNKVFNTMRYYSHAFHDNSVVSELYEDSWRAGDNEDAKYPRITNQFVDNNNYRISDFYIEDASYLRLKNVQLGYMIPKKWAGKIKTRNIRIAIGATNLFTLTNYTGFDPEVGADEIHNRSLGVDIGVYPQNRTYLGSITIDF